VDVDAYDAPVVPSPVAHVASVTDRVMEHSKSHPRMLKSTLTVTRSERRRGRATATRALEHEMCDCMMTDDRGCARGYR
jgi:hypothetical protein